MKNLILLTALFLNMTWCMGGTGTIQGTIKDAQTSEGIPFANVVLVMGNKTVAGNSCNLDGKYRIPLVPPGTYDMTVSSVGYKIITVTGVVISPDNITFKDVMMEASAELLSEFVVVDYVVPLIQKDQTTSGATMTSNDTKRMPGRNPESIAISAGGAFSSNGEIGSVRGARTEGTTTYIDGVKIRSSSAIPKSAVDQVSVVTGGLPAAYGDVSAGVISVDAGNGNVKRSKNTPSHKTKRKKVSASDQKTTLAIVEDTDDSKNEELSPQAGKLTATEINDFKKWALWQDLSRPELAVFNSLWNINPEKRYTVQVKGTDNRAIADADAVLIGINNTILWHAKTDNTGKAELWSGLFADAEEAKEIKITYRKDSYTISNPVEASKGVNMMAIHAYCAVPEHVDIAFVVDATGSMTDEIQFLKTDLLDIIESSSAMFQGVKFNLGSVFYRCFGNSYVTRHEALGNDIGRTVAFINRQFASEGGSEAVEEALRVAVDSLKWSNEARARLLFLVLDEQPLTNIEVMNTFRCQIQKAAQQGIRIIPVVGSAENMSNAKSMEYLMRCVALATNGTYVALTDHSNIGSAHAAPTTDTYDVELLNNLIKRLIFQYCYMPLCEDPAFLSPPDSLLPLSPIVATEVIIKHRKPMRGKTPDMNIGSFMETLLEQAYGHQNENETPIPDNKNNESDIAAQVLFYPNPTTGPLTAVIKASVDMLYVYDISGKLLKTYDVPKQNDIQVDLGEYSTGLYFIRYRIKDAWESEKIVLRK